MSEFRDSTDSADVNIESEALPRLACVLQSIAWWCRADGSAVYFNDQWYQRTHMTVEGSVDWGWLNSVHSDDRSLIVEAWREAANSLSAITLEVRFRMVDDEYRWHSLRANPAVDMRGWLCIADDINANQIRIEQSRNEAVAILETAVDGIVTIDDKGIIQSFNKAAERIFRYQSSEVLESNVSILMPDPYRLEHDTYLSNYVQTGAKRVIGIGREVQGVRRDGSVFPLDIAVSEWTSFGRKRFTGIIRDLSEKSTLVARLNGQYRVLDKLVHECSLGEVLRTLVEASEAAQPGMTASILLLDRKKQTLRHGASTSLPEFYVKAIDGVAIGPDVGSCGTAAFTAHRVIVEDIQSHPFWRNYKDIAKQASLGSCWSEPIISTNGSALGTFAMYYHEPHIPEDGDLEFASSFAHLAAVAIERTQTNTTQRRMAAIIESTDDAVLSRNLDGLVESWNKGAERLFGYTAAEIIGKPICLLVPEDRMQELLNLRDCLNRNERVDHFETIRITKSGDRIEVSLTSSPIYDTEGSVIAFSTIARDISDRRRAEQALREKQDTLIMLDATEIISWEIDLVTNQSSWNNRYTKVFGARDDVDSRWWRERIHPDDRERVTSSFVAALEGDCNIWKDEYRFRRADGSYAVLLDHAYFSRNESGKAIRVTGAKFDVTESKQLKAKLLASERLAAIGQMLTAIAHESRSALARISAGLDLLRFEIDKNSEAANDLDRIMRAKNDLAQLFDELRSYAAPIGLNTAKANLQTAWQNAWANVEPMRVGRAVSLVESIADADLQCSIDVFRMSQVFTNFFENSLAACSDPVQIQISVHNTEWDSSPATIIRYRDNGPGLSGAVRARIFEAFFTTKDTGTGLGMAIAKRIVDEHGGELTVGSGDYSGAEFLIKLRRNFT